MPDKKVMCLGHAGFQITSEEEKIINTYYKEILS